MRGFGLTAIALGLSLASGARAEVVDATPSGFQVTETAEIAAPAGQVWKSLSRIDRWWSPAHTWSGSAGNLYLGLTRDGELRENLPNGGYVRHLRVIYLNPGKEVIFDGALGPLVRSGATGHLDWKLTEQNGRTTLTQTYYVGGYFPGGLDKLASTVDGVLDEQLGRLKRYVETGKPA